MLNLITMKKELEDKLAVLHTEVANCEAELEKTRTALQLHCPHTDVLRWVTHGFGYDSRDYSHYSCIICGKEVTECGDGRLFWGVSENELPAAIAFFEGLAADDMRGLRYIDRAQLLDLCASHNFNLTLFS